MRLGQEPKGIFASGYVVRGSYEDLHWDSEKGLAHSSWHYEAAQETPDNEHLMQLIDQQFTETPFYGIRRMTAWLKTQGEPVNPKRVARWMQKMGLEAIYPKPNLSLPGADNRRYPYLLRDVTITAAYEVWSTVLSFSPGCRHQSECLFQLLQPQALTSVVELSPPRAPVGISCAARAFRLNQEDGMNYSRRHV